MGNQPKGKGCTTNNSRRAGTANSRRADTTASNRATGLNKATAIPRSKEDIMGAGRREEREERGWVADCVRGWPG